MGLTEEQKERIRKNRERALEIQRQRKEREQKETGKHGHSDGSNDHNDRCNSNDIDFNKRQKIGSITEDGSFKKAQGLEDDDIELEDFEINSSQYVTASEAKDKYCLPDGTLNVCEYIEKENPRNKKFKPMKLYYRSEIRKRARNRYNGLQGLVEEREKRQMKKFYRDYEKTKDIFKK